MKESFEKYVTAKRTIDSKTSKKFKGVFIEYKEVETHSENLLLPIINDTITFKNLANFVIPPSGFLDISSFKTLRN